MPRILPQSALRGDNAPLVEVVSPVVVASDLLLILGLGVEDDLGGEGEEDVVEAGGRGEKSGPGLLARRYSSSRTDRSQVKLTIRTRRARTVIETGQREI